MNNMQKRAVCNILMWLFLLAMFIVFDTTANDSDLWSTLCIAAFLGLVVVVGLTPMLCQKFLPGLFHRVRSGFEVAESGFRFFKRTDFDERNRAIKSGANLAGYIAAFWLYAVACLITSFKESIPGSVLALVLITGFGVFIFTRSLAILIQYGRGGTEHE